MHNDIDGLKSKQFKLADNFFINLFSSSEFGNMEGLVNSLEVSEVQVNVR